MPRSRRVRRERIHDWPQIQQETLGPEQKGGVASRLPLSALLSQVLVAFTIEFDNEFEHQMPTRCATSVRLCSTFCRDTIQNKPIS